MEVLGERPPAPPLPPKTRMNHLNTELSLKQNIIIRNDEVPKKETGQKEPRSVCASADAAQSAEKSPRTLAKFANAHGRKSPRIITWAQADNSYGESSDTSLLSINSFYKSTEPDKDDEFLYQNVSNAGTNYIEYKLNGFISKNGTKEILKNAKNQSERKPAEKSYRINSTPSNRQIEVHQTNNKTVVKISIKDNNIPVNDSQFRPVKLENRYRNENGKMSFSSLPDYSARSGPKSSYDHRDCDDESEYANISLGNQRQDKYRLSDDQVYANLNASDPECDQAYENSDMDTLKNNRVTQGIIERNPAPADEQIYENQLFGEDGNAYENMQKMQNGSDNALADATSHKPCVRVNVENHTQKTETTQDKMKSRKVVVTINSLQSESDELKKDYENHPGHKRAESLTSSGVGVDSESDGEGSNISCDSLNSNELNALSTSEDHGYHTPNSENKTGSPVDDYQNIVHGDAYENATVAREYDDEIYENFQVFETHKKKQTSPPPPPPKPKKSEEPKSLPKGLLRDIQSRSVKLSAAYPKGEKGSDDGVEKEIAKKIITFSQLSDKRKEEPKVEEKPYEERKKEPKSENVSKICAIDVDTDQFYKFHLFENRQEANGEKNANEEETFAGVKDYLNREKQAAIKSAKGTIRGVKNRVKAGIATFLQMQENKNYKDRDAGKIVVYSTTMGIVRETYHKCLKVKQILRTLMVKFEERDVFMSTEAQEEIRERMKCDAILVPQVFVEGQHIGDAETIERLNESGELRKILKPYKSMDACVTCQVCGGYRLLPCSVCKGSKKSVRRNHFTAEFVALKCMNCDQVGLTKCYAC